MSSSRRGLLRCKALQRICKERVPIGQPLILPPTIEERVRAVELMRRDRAARWGRFAWRIAKAGGFILAAWAHRLWAAHLVCPT
jgi:hypothetical protein